MRPPLPAGREDRERGGTQARAMIGAGGRSVGLRPGGMCDQCPVVPGSCGRVSHSATESVSRTGWAAATGAKQAGRPGAERRRENMRLGETLDAHERLDTGGRERFVKQPEQPEQDRTSGKAFLSLSLARSPWTGSPPPLVGGEDGGLVPLGRGFREGRWMDRMLWNGGSGRSPWGQWIGIWAVWAGLEEAASGLPSCRQ